MQWVPEVKAGRLNVSRDPCPDGEEQVGHKIAGRGDAGTH
jgi:hypothetical protein